MRAQRSSARCLPSRRSGGPCKAGRRRAREGRVAYAEKVYKVRNGVKTKQFTWRCKYKLPDGREGSESGFPTKVKAIEWGEEQERQIREGTWIDPRSRR